MAAGTSKSRCVVPPECDRRGITMTNDAERSEHLCQRFSTVDVVFVLVSLFTYVLDLVTDCLLAWQFFSVGHSVCGVWTIVFVLVPTLTLQLLSIRWYIAENQSLCCSWILLAHIFGLGPVQRYMSVLQHGRDARRSNSPQSYKKLYQAQNDISCLRFIEAYLESAPQLILQGYFILTVQPLTWVSGLSTSVSLVSLAWAVASYSNALRLAYREAYLTRWGGLVLQALWHIGTVASRVVAIAVFASVYHAWTFLAIGAHWLAMSVWVFIQGPEFFSRRWENKLFSFVLGVVYIFCFLNLKDGPTRYKMWPFYLVLLAENGLLVGLWYREHPSQDTLMIIVTAVVFGGYLLGVLFLLLYYGWCHPSGPISLCREQKSAIHNDHADTDQQGHEGAYHRRVFDASLTSATLNPVFTSGYDLSLDSSWSGLVHSRRGDDPTFTTSKYKTSSRQLDFEGNHTQGEPSDVCTRVFDAPCCGPTTPGYWLVSQIHQDQSGAGDQQFLCCLREYL
ncbi:XK-related protein 6-like [Liolophura sinensis]|uniref:XK-related protein 6-like n=1 Tax=Liolophura sinensis TaxID=3198878 RepID=UPI0031583834